MFVFIHPFIEKNGLRFFVVEASELWFVLLQIKQGFYHLQKDLLGNEKLVAMFYRSDLLVHANINLVIFVQNRLKKKKIKIFIENWQSSFYRYNIENENIHQNRPLTVPLLVRDQNCRPMGVGKKNLFPTREQNLIISALCLLLGVKRSYLTEHIFWSQRNNNIINW